VDSSYQISHDSFSFLSLSDAFLVSCFLFFLDFCSEKNKKRKKKRIKKKQKNENEMKSRTNKPVIETLCFPMRNAWRDNKN